MGEIQMQIVVEGKVYALDGPGMDALFAACRVKKSFGGTEYSDPEYGIVDVELGPEGKRKKYRVQTGNWEWEQAEIAFKVKGIQNIIKATESEENQTKFYRIALLRHQKDMTHREVADLRDWKPRDGGPTLKDAVERAIAFSKPHIFPDEEVDPKAVQAVKAGLVMMTLPESPSTT